MKRNVSKVLSVLLIAALMLSFTAVASAETRMYATRAVNVRSGPSTSYYILGSLEQNEMVMATGRVYDGWYEIQWGSYGYAYVAGNYLSYSKYEPGYNPNYNCYPGNRGVTLKVCPDCGDTYYSTTALNVRRGPSTKYSIVGSLNRGQKCTVVGKSGNWYKLLTADGSDAYASAKYLKLYARQNGSPPSPPSPPSYPSGNYGTYYATTGLNVRQGPSTKYRVVYTLDRGEAVTFTGRGRLMERPQCVYETLYREQNLRFEQSLSGLTVEGALTPGDYRLAGNVSSQFISGLLFALPLLDGDSTLHLIPPVESRSYIDMTRAVQAAFGVHSRWLDETTLLLPGGQQYHPCDYNVEGDYSQAAFPAVLGAVCGGVTITGLAPDTLQGDAAILDILRRCGAVFTRTAEGISFEKAPLHGVDIDLADCPDLGPVLMVLGLLCEGTTVIRNAQRLRLKESDRIAAMEAELRACGGVLESEGGTITVHGCAEHLHAPEGILHGHNDHRVVMSLAVLSAAAGLPLTVDDAEAIQKSWPGFFADAAPLGVEVEDA